MNTFAKVYDQEIAPQLDGLEFSPIPNDVYQPDTRHLTTVPAYIGRVALPGAAVVIHVVDASKIEADEPLYHPYVVVNPQTAPPGYFLRADIIPPIEPSELDRARPHDLRLLRYAAVYTNLSQERMESIDDAQRRQRMAGLILAQRMQRNEVVVDSTTRPGLLDEPAVSWTDQDLKLAWTDNTDTHLPLRIAINRRHTWWDTIWGEQQAAAQERLLPAALKRYAGTEDESLIPAAVEMQADTYAYAAAEALIITKIRDVLGLPPDTVVDDPTPRNPEIFVRRPEDLRQLIHTLLRAA